VPGLCTEFSAFGRQRRFDHLSRRTVNRQQRMRAAAQGLASGTRATLLLNHFRRHECKKELHRGRRLSSGQSVEAGAALKIGRAD
jgi:hypothetical protein